MKLDQQLPQACETKTLTKDLADLRYGKGRYWDGFLVSKGSLGKKVYELYKELDGWDTSGECV